MKKSEILTLIDLFKSKAKEKKHLYEGSINHNIMFKIFDEKDEAVAAIGYTDSNDDEDFICQIAIGYGYYTCDNFEIAKLLIDFIKY